jgi:hypothetical protein
MRSLVRAASWVCVIFAPLTYADVPPADSPTLGAARDEVVVQGSRTLDEIRQKMVKLEDRFYDRYNELNTIRDFDIHCGQEARVGTLLKRRYCRAVYESKAFEAEGREVAQFLQNIPPPNTNPAAAGIPRDPPVVIGAPPPPAFAAIEARRPEFRKNMLDVTSKNPELIKLLQERAELAKQYDAARRKLFGSKPPPEE